MHFCDTSVALGIPKSDRGGTPGLGESTPSTTPAPWGPAHPPSRRFRGDTELVDIEDVAARYQRGISHAENLIKLHGKAGTAARIGDI